MPLRRDNTFLFSDLPDASYLLTIHSRDYFFPPLRVDVAPYAGEGGSQNISAWATFRGNEWDNKGQPFGTGRDELRIEVRAGAEKQYYQERGGFSILSFLKSPMILMGLASVVLIFGMPYLMDNSKFVEAKRENKTTWEERMRSREKSDRYADLLSYRSGSGNQRGIRRSVDTHRWVNS